MARKMTPVQVARRISLGIFLALATVLPILHQRLPGMPSIDGICPFGGLEGLYAWVAGQGLLKYLYPGNIVLLGGIVAVGVVAARFFCGWICALGSLQGIFGSLGRRIFRRRFDLPRPVDRVLRWVKYPVLAAILFFTWQTGTLVVRHFDPWAAWGHLSAGWEELWGEFALGLVILAATLVLSLFSDRVFCKYLCPLGAFNGLLARIPLLRIKRDNVTCTDCKACDRRCPMALDISPSLQVPPGECIGCQECVSTCPTRKDTLSLHFAGRKVSPWLVVVLGLGLYLAALGVGQALGMARFGPEALATLHAEGRASIADIKGSATWADVAATFGVDMEALMEVCGVDPSKVPGTTQLKATGKLAGISGWEADLVRKKLAEMTGLPYGGEGAH